MAIMNFALLALVPFVLARPQVGHGDSHKAFHGPHTAGTGLPGPFSHNSYPHASGTAPFPVPGGNSTSGAATGSSGAPLTTGNGGPVYVTSTINVVPTPITSDVTDSAADSAATGGAGGPGAGNSGSGAQQTGDAGGAGGIGGSGVGTACGPATVTVTNANTVTVTVTPAGGAGQTSLNGAAGASSQVPTIPSSAIAPTVSSAPFPIGNSTAPAGTGTGTAVSSAPTFSVAAVQTTSSSVPAAQPYQSVAEKYKPYHSQESPAPAPSSSTSSVYVAPPAPSPNTPAPQPSPASSAIAQAPSAPASSSAPAASSSAPSTPKTAGAKGVAYNTPAQASQVSGLAWACNWGQTADVSNPSFEFVPQLWGNKPGMADSIKSNCAGAKACLFYNEPDMSLAVGGSGIDVNTAISDFTSIMKPIQSAGSKVSTPCVANSDSSYMQTFVSAFPSGSIDIMCFHWYGNDLEGLKSTVGTFQALASQHGIKEMWINEWAVQPAPGDLSSYTSYLDGAVTRYAYNMNDIAGSTGY